jgi:predicted metal-dependent hydrolase
MPDGAPDVIPALAWLAAASPPVQIVGLILVSALIALLLLRLPVLIALLPAVADAVARVRGKGVTERERELERALADVQGELRDVREELRSIQHWREEQLRLFEMLMPRAQCLMPDCKQADVGDLLREIVDTWRQSASAGTVVHGTAD